MIQLEPFLKLASIKESLFMKNLAQMAHYHVLMLMLMLGVVLLVLVIKVKINLKITLGMLKRMTC